MKTYYFLKTMAAVIVVSMFLLMIPLSLRCQSVEKYDIDNSGNLSLTEIQAYLVNTRKTPFNKIDTDNNGVISPSELTNVTSKYVTDLAMEYGSRNAYSFAEVERLLTPGPELSLFGILIRDSFEEVTIADDPKGFSKAKAGTVAYEHDKLTNASTFSAKVSILRPFRLDNPMGTTTPNNAYVSAVGLVPSITLDRKTSSDSTKEVNTLQVRVGLDIEVFQGFVDLQNLRVYSAWATDVFFKSKVAALEIGWLPTELRLGMGVYRDILSGWLEYRWRIYPYLEGGYVFDAGEKKDIVTEDLFVRSGGKLMFDLRLFGLNQLEFLSSYRYLHGFADGPKDVRMTEVNASYKFGVDGHFSLEAKYTKGNVAITLDEKDAFTFGLGLKF